MAEESSLSFRGAQFTGPPRSVLAALTIVALAVLAGLFIWLNSGDGGDVREPAPTVTFAPEIEGEPSNVDSNPPALNTYGDDPVLDILWDDCETGFVDACWDLYWESPVGSGYELFAEGMIE